TGALRIAALNHEVWNYTMENSAVVERVFALLARVGMSPLALAFGEFGKVGDGLRSIFLKKTANDVAFAGIENGVSAGRACHWFLVRHWHRPGGRDGRTSGPVRSHS